MEAEDLIKLPASSSTDSESDRDSTLKFNHDLFDDEANGDHLSTGHMEPVEIEEGQISPGRILSSIFKENADLIENHVDQLKDTSDIGENGFNNVQDEMDIGDLATDGTS